MSEKGLYSDLDEFLEEGGRPNVNKNVQNEGNIPQGDPDRESAQKQGNIKSSDPQPTSPQTEGNIKPSDPDNQSPNQKGQIQSEKPTPESPDQSPIDSSEQSFESPDRTPIEPRDEEFEDDRKNKIPVSDRAPDPPQHTGNIKPRGFQEPTEDSEIEAEESKPDSPNKEDNIFPTEDSRPNAPNRVNIEPREESEPQNADQGSRTATENAQPSRPSRKRKEPGPAKPKNPERNIIRLREEARPSRPTRSGNIESSESKPPTPNRSENIGTEASRTENVRDADQTIRQSDSGTGQSGETGNIQPTEEPVPPEPNRNENISSTDSRPPSVEDRPLGPQFSPEEEVRPKEPNRDENIQPTEDARPLNSGGEGNVSPSESGDAENLGEQQNINPTEESEPPSPSREGNIQPEDSRPLNSSRKGNVSPSESGEAGNLNQEESITPTEESEPQSPNRDENIPPTENSEPAAPDKDGSIQPEDSRPLNSSREGDVSPSESGEAGNLNQEENITPTENSEPKQPSLEDNINEEDSRPQKPQKEDNINEEDRRPGEPTREDNINEDDRRPDETDLEGNIEVEAGPRGQLRPFRQTDTDRDPKAPKENQFQPKGLEASPYLGENYTDTGENASFPGKGDGASEWEVPLRYQPQKRFENQISQTGKEFRDEIGEFFTGEKDGVPEWQTPLRHQPQKRFENQIRSEDTEFVEVISGKGDGAPEWDTPLRYQPERFASQIAQQDTRFVEVVSGKGDEAAEWQTPLRYQPERLEDQIDPESAEFRDGVGESFQGEGDGSAEWEVPLRYQPQRLENQIDPESLEFRDGIGEIFQGEGDGQAQANARRQFQVRYGSTSLEDLNRTVRLEEFSTFGNTRNINSLLDGASGGVSGILSLEGNAGLSAEPFIIRRPVEGGGDPAIQNIKDADSRKVPLGSAALDTARIGKFFSTAKGLLYNVKQGFLQGKNPRKRTQLYDPTAPIRTAAEGMASRPGEGITRHIDASSSPQGIVGDAADAIGGQLPGAAGFDVPKSSEYEDELEERRVATEKGGDFRGSLFWLSPFVFGGVAENQGGSSAAKQITETLSEQSQNIKELHSSKESSKASKFFREILGRSVQGQVASGYLFTKTYDPQGGPNSEGRVERDNYHPFATYVQNLDNMNSRNGPTGEDFSGVEFISYVRDLRSRTTDRRAAQSEASFPFFNPTQTPSTDEITDGNGNVKFNRQNDTTDEVYYENRAFSRGNGRIPIHRGVPGQEQSRGLPNYSKTDEEDGSRENRLDLINRLEPIIGQDADPEQEIYGDGEYKDLIPFKFYDIENDGLIVFRAFLDSLSDNPSPEWSQKDYAGRPEQGHTYGGYSNTISVSFQVAPFSEEEFRANWKKVNYLKGLTTPARYQSARGGGAYMVPPFMRMTIGDMFNDVYGYMNSLSISVNNDAPWELDESTGRLPRVLEIDVDWQVIQKRAPAALQKLYDAPFIDEVSEVVREAPEPREEIQPQSADEPLERPGIENGRAIEKSSEPPAEGSSLGGAVRQQNQANFA